MIKKSIFVILLSLVFLASSALANSTNSIKNYRLPNNAIQIYDNVYDLGMAYDKQSRSMVKGYAFVHKNGDVKVNAAKGPKAPACYGYLANGAKWKNVENWALFPGAELNGDFLLNNTTGNIAKWETAAGTPNILGAGNFGAGDPSDPNILDEKNEISFAQLSDNQAIAVTVVWGIFSGPTANRRLVAWDQIYNTDYDWTANALLDPAKMDFENISTHELGHAVGMNDIYNSSCSAVTMYGYADFGQTNKRDLAPADITGIDKLY